MNESMNEKIPFINLKTFSTLLPPSFLLWASFQQYNHSTTSPTSRLTTPTLTTPFFFFSLPPHKTSMATPIATHPPCFHFFLFPSPFLFLFLFLLVSCETHLHTHSWPVIVDKLPLSTPSPFPTLFIPPLSLSLFILFYFYLYF